MAATTLGGRRGRLPRSGAPSRARRTRSTFEPCSPRVCAHYARSRQQEPWVREWLMLQVCTSQRAGVVRAARQAGANNKGGCGLPRGCRPKLRMRALSGTSPNGHFLSVANKHASLEKLPSIKLNTTYSTERTARKSMPTTAESMGPFI